MRDTIALVQDMCTAVTAFLPKELAARDGLAWVSKYAFSIEWKLRFLDHHCKVLCDFPWQQLNRIGTISRDSVRLDCGNNSDLVIEIMRSDADRLLVLMCFDGVVANCVNMVDTLGRLLNLAYSLGLQQDRANLPQVMAKIVLESPLGVVCSREPGCEWMAPLRQLRGECQHGDISNMLESPGTAFGGTAQEPVVRDDFCLDGLDSKKVSNYVEFAKSRSIQLLRRIAETVICYKEHAAEPSETAQG